MINIRTMTPLDIEAGLLLCRAAQWNQVAEDWAFFLQQSPLGCLVAVKDSAVVGTVTTIRYATGLSWVGMMLVDPAHQGQGIGRLLMQAALTQLEALPVIKLDATADGRKLYLKLGFEDEYNITRMQGTHFRLPPASPLTAVIKAEALAAVGAYDQQCLGVDRYTLLEWLWRRAPSLSRVVRNGDEVVGYCLGRRGYRSIQIGPLVANDAVIAQQILSGVLASCEGQSVVLDTTTVHTAWAQWLSAIGMQARRSFVRMYKGRQLSIHQPAQQFAISGPEFG